MPASISLVLLGCLKCLCVIDLTFIIGIFQKTLFSLRFSNFAEYRIFFSFQIFSLFTFQMLFQKFPIPSPALLPYPPTPSSWAWCSPVLGHIKCIRPRGLMQQCLSLVSDYRMEARLGQSLDGPSFHLSSKLCLCNSFHGYFIPYSRQE